MRNNASFPATLHGQACIRKASAQHSTWRPYMASLGSASRPQVSSSLRFIIRYSLQRQRYSPRHTTWRNLENESDFEKS